MTFQKEYDDIFNLSADAIVIPVGAKIFDAKGKRIELSSNSLEKQLYERADYNQLIAARMEIQNGILDSGTAIITKSFGLENYRYIIMVATPINPRRELNDLIATPAKRELVALKKCCKSILDTVKEFNEESNDNINSVCIPLLGAGVNRLPRRMVEEMLTNYFETETNNCWNEEMLTVTLCISNDPVREDGVEISKRVYMTIAEEGYSSDDTDYILNGPLANIWEEDFYEHRKNIELYEMFVNSKRDDSLARKRSLENLLRENVSLKAHDILGKIMYKNNLSQAYLCRVMGESDTKKMSQWFSGNRIPKKERDTYLVMACLVGASQLELEQIANACATDFPRTARDGLMLWHLRYGTYKTIIEAENNKDYYEEDSIMTNLNDDFIMFCKEPFYQNEREKSNKKYAE